MTRMKDGRWRFRIGGAEFWGTLEECFWAMKVMGVGR